jgi:hypothetical protein
MNCDGWDERWYYIQRCAAEFWSVDALKSHIANNDFATFGALPNNFILTMPNEKQANKAVRSFKDEYLLDFVNIEDETEEELIEIEETESSVVAYENFKKIEKNGFIEIFNEGGYITTEYRFQHEGEVSKIIYNYKGAFMIDSAAFLWEENDIGGRFSEIHRDSYRYNRSSFLRAIDRVYLKDQKITQSDPVRITFPGNILNTARNDSFMGEKLHAYPEFFGDLFVQKNSRMVFTTDQRGRVITQTLYSDDEESRVIWTIVNTWAGDRIASTQKTEGDVVLISEYEYDSKDNRILERNIKNGVIERVVRTEGKKDIEELYFNNVIVLRAVYEDGRKISETRVRNN